MEIGNIAPLFTSKINGEKDFDLKNFLGQWIVLYFYPKDDTSGCTKEACEFRDNMERINNFGANVFGVSPDTVKSHDKFKEKYNLNFSLIADPNKEICNLYGVMGEKKMYGKTYMGVIRSTFIINPKGEIAFLWKNVKVDGHIDEVIQKLEELKN